MTKIQLINNYVEAINNADSGAMWNARAALVEAATQEPIEEVDHEISDALELPVGKQAAVLNDIATRLANA